MSDYRDPNDPLWRNATYNPDERAFNASWGWIAGAVFLVVVLAIAVGIRHEPTRTASNDVGPPASSRLAPPPSALNPAAPNNPASPSLMPRPAPAPEGTPSGQ